MILNQAHPLGLYSVVKESQQKSEKKLDPNRFFGKFYFEII